VLVEFFPEGGNLVAGVPCRVFFRATTPSGEPVDIRGTLTDGRRTLAEIETVTGDVEGVNRGLGSFTFTPEIDTPVWVKLTAPEGMFAPIIVPNRRDFPVAASAAAGIPLATAARAGFLLPRALEEGVAMTVLDAVTEPGQAIRVHLRSVGQARKLVVGAYTRGRLSDTQRVTVEPNELKEVRLMANADPRGGVVRITVFEEPSDEELRRVKAGETPPDMKPVAERLVFRKPGEALNLGYSVKGASGPGSAAELDITATDEKGNPVAAVLYAAAVNSGVARGEKDRLLTTHFLIAGEVTTPDGLEHADFLLTDHPQAPAVLDGVLATQGWRRFAEQTPSGYVRRPTAPTEEYRNLLVTNGQFSVWTDPVALREQRRQLETFLPEYEAAKKARDAAQAALAAANADRSAEARAKELAAKVDAARAEARKLAERADAAAEPLARFHEAGWYGVAGFGLLALLLAGLCVARPAVRLPLGIGSAGALGLVAFLVFALGSAEKSQAATRDQALPPAQAKALPPPTVDREDLAAGVVAEMVVDKPTDDARGAKQHDAPGRAEFGRVAEPAVEALPQRSGFAGAKRGKPAAAGPAAGTILPRIEPSRPVAPMSAGGGVMPGFGSPQSSRGGMGRGGLGGFGGSGGVGESFFDRMMKRLEAPPPPRPKSAAEPPPGVAALSPPAPATASVPPPKSKLMFKELPGGMTAMGKTARFGPVPKIPLDERAKDMRPMAFDLQSVLPAPSLPAPGGAPPGLKVEQSLRSFTFSTEQAQLFARNKANEFSEQLLESMARRHNVPVDDIKKAVDRARKGTGWIPKGDEPPLALTLEDATAYFNIEQAVPKVAPLVVREYAPPRPGAADGYLQESRDTILWQPAIVLPSDGKGKLQFYLGDAPGGYQLLVGGHTLDGRIGAVRGIIPVGPQQTTTPAKPVPPPEP
jgi:hypothetical protein